jgi:hypothetical protein
MIGCLNRFVIFPYCWAVVCEGCPFFSVGLILAVFFLCYICTFRFCMSFVGSYYFAPSVVLKSILFVSIWVLMEVSAFW